MVEKHKELPILAFAPCQYPQKRMDLGKFASGIVSKIQLAFGTRQGTNITVIGGPRNHSLQTAWDAP